MPYPDRRHPAGALQVKLLGQMILVVIQRDKQRRGDPVAGVNLPAMPVSKGMNALLLCSQRGLSIAADEFKALLVEKDVKASLLNAFSDVLSDFPSVAADVVHVP